MTLHNRTQSTLLTSPKIQLLIISIVYIVLESIFGFANRYHINPDGIAYLRLAGYIAEGNFQQSVSGHWGPIISWLLAPFLFLGFDGLNAARFVLAISGLILLSGCWLLADRFNFVPSIKFIVLLVATLLIVSWSKIISPDMLMPAFLVLYLYMVTSPDILTSKKTALLCGVFGGLAYLSKHYALPLFLASFPLILSLRGYLDRDDLKFVNKRFISVLLTGFISFLVFVSPLMIAYHIKYDRFTIGTTGLYNFAAIGPEAISLHPPWFGLRQPAEHAIHLWEDPNDFEDSKMWSPFENKEYLKKHIKLILTNINRLYSFFTDNFFIAGILSICFLPFAFFIKRDNPEEKFLYGWIMIIIFLYCSGHILIYLTTDGARYFYFVFLIVVMLAFKFVQEIIHNRSAAQKDETVFTKNLKTYVLLFVILSFSLSPVLNFIISINKVPDNHQNLYKNIGSALSSVEFSEPFALIGSGPSNIIALGVAYYTDKKFLGRVLSSDLEGITKELKDADARSVLVSSKLTMAERLKEDERYQYITTIKKGELGWDEEINVFIVY